MGKLSDLQGKRFGRLVVLEYCGNNSRNEAIWNCVCDCGNYKKVRTNLLKCNKTKSCGCLKREEEANRKEHPHKKTHGMSKTRIYVTWLNMRSRCNNKNNDMYMYYGGRGIKVCDEWKDSFENFRDWALSNGYNDSLELDRIDCNKNYEPCNCRFVGRVKQMNNIRNNIVLTYMNETKTINEWARELGIAASCLKWRFYSGWKIEDILNTPSGGKRNATN